jgi:acylglycerol lipase
MSAFDFLAKRLVNEGLAAYAFDQRGFGRSDGLRMHMDRWEDGRGDLAAFLRLVRSREPGKKVFAFGISYGACRVVDQAITTPSLLDGIIAMSFSTIPLKLPPFVKAMISLLGAAFPKLAIPAEKTDDPLCPRTMTAGFIKRLADRQRSIGGELGALKLPVLHMQGKEDSITLPDASIMENIGSDDYSYKEYEGAGHVVFEGKDPEKAMQDICDWVNARLA